jgi:hypothetical protein
MAGFITMATTTPNYGWPVPTSTDFVKDGATAIEALGDAIDATVFALPSGLSFITGASFSAVTSFSLPADTFSSTYDNYKVIAQITALTTDATFTGRLRASGADNTTANYANAMLGVTYGGATSNSTATSQTSFSFAESDSVNVRYFLSMDIISPKTATPTFLSGFYNFFQTSGPSTIARSGNMQFTDNTQFDSFSFISSVASSITGSYRVYGYANS